MQVDGKEFLRNVNIEKEKAKLDRQRKNLEESKVDAVRKEPDYFEDSNNLNTGSVEDAAYLDLSINNQQTPNDNTMAGDNQLFDIKLDQNSNDNKKRYIILGFALILLFILTIVIVRIISNSEEEEKLNNKTQPNQERVQQVKEDEKLNKIETDNSFKEKEIIEEEEFKQPSSLVAPTQAKKDIILPEPVKEKSPVEIEQQKRLKAKDLFGLERQNEGTIIEEMKKVEKKPTPKPKPKPVVKEKPKKVTKPAPKPEPKRKPVVKSEPKKKTGVKSTSVSGYYIQVGSFTKQPSAKYLKSISSKGYDYAVHRMNIKGKYYNKILIGPFSSRTAAKGSLSKVRKAFNVPGAYILKF